MNQGTLKFRVLIIDDEKSICSSLAGVVEDEGWLATTVGDGTKGLIEVKLNPPDLVFLDIWMPGMDGITVLQRLREMVADLPVVIMSGHATIETAVKATRLGAFEVLEKPLELNKILALLEQAKVLVRKKQSGAVTKPTIDLIGVSAQIELMRKQIAAVGPKNASVLITGENGSGKEVIARLIHQLSPRAAKPFIAINCAAIPEELIEAELFGHVKGAFTNAITDRKGRFELAHQGTIFLDEIGDMSLKTQAKILRILQERSFERVGDHRSIQVDVRVLAATNRDLSEAIRVGNFREDLYYRLNVIPLVMRPLRERRDDVPVLVQYFLHELCPAGATPPVMSPAVMAALVAHDWPGNVRELKNVIERLIIMTGGGQITEDDLPRELLGADCESIEAKQGQQSLKDAKSDFERSFILAKLEENDWNVSKTADALNIERSNLHRKLKSYDIDLKKIKG
jgi:two-component system, NtrC family, nitrogen regulation response regulator NtrX